MVVCSVCQTETQYDKAEQNYCVFCGWPLARLHAAAAPNPVILERAANREVIVTLSNQGAGLLRCRLDPDAFPAGVSVSSEQETHYDAIRPEPGGADRANSVEVRLKIAAAGLEAFASGTLTLPLTAFDQHPEEFRDRHTGLQAFRPASRAEAVLKRDASVSIPFAFRAPVRVEILTPNLLFRKGRKNPQTILLHNRGGVETELTLTSSEGFLLKSVGDQPGATSLRMTLPPNMPCKALVQQPQHAAAAGRAAEIILQGKGLTDINGDPVETQTIGLYSMQPKTQERPKKRYLIGIDFGTAKSAVFVVDRMAYATTQSAMQMRPINVPFPNKGKDSPTVPSEVMFPGTSASAPPRFGFDAFSTLPTDLTVRSIKSLLSQSQGIAHPSPLFTKTYQPVEIVTEFLKGLIKQVQRSPVIPRDDVHADIFKQAQVIMTLPILDDDKQFEKQKELTLEAARQAGMPPEAVIVCEKEPECAIVDILRRKDEYGLEIRDGQYGIIVDAGAGTLDISVLQVSIKDKQPTFSRCVLAGFPLGGDLIDALLLADATRELQLDFKDKPDEKEDLRRDLRDMKHSLPLIPSDDTPDIESKEVERTFSGKKYTLSWQKIHRLFGTYLDLALTSETGLKASEVALAFGRKPEKTDTLYPSLRAKMREIDPYLEGKVAWVCLTGGTSVVPLLRSSLRAMFDLAKIIPEEEQFHKLYASSPIFFTLNVAQGAAIRPLFAFEGLLSFPMRVECYSKQSVKIEPAFGITAAALEQPGDRGPASVYSIEPGDRLEARVFGSLESAEVLWGRCFVENPDEENPLDVELTLHYQNNQEITLEITPRSAAELGGQSGSPPGGKDSIKYTIVA